MDILIIHVMIYFRIDVIFLIKSLIKLINHTDFNERGGFSYIIII